jgi:hypothetical protein
VAGALQLQKHEVADAIASAREKLGARSKLEAVLIADRTGQLDAAP